MVGGHVLLVEAAHHLQLPLQIFNIKIQLLHIKLLIPLQNFCVYYLLIDLISNSHAILLIDNFRLVRALLAFTMPIRRLPISLIGRNANGRGRTQVVAVALVDLL